MKPLARFDEFQQRHRALAVPVAVVKQFGEDGGGTLAAAIAFYGFFSLFPLMLVFVSVLGFVLDGNPSAQQQVVDSALTQFPIVGDQLQSGSLSGSVVALVVGLLGAITAGLGVTLATQIALRRVLQRDAPQSAQPGFVAMRLRGLKLLAVLGTLQIISTVATGAVSGGLGGPLLAVGGVVVSLMINALLFFAAFRLLTDASVTTRDLRPGIIVGAVAWTALQAVGGAYIGHVVKGAGATYGTFATVIGLLTWLFLGGVATSSRATVSATSERGQVRSRRTLLTSAE